MQDLSLSALIALSAGTAPASSAVQAPRADGVADGFSACRFAEWPGGIGEEPSFD